jgi:hypothetical protein
MAMSKLSDIADTIMPAKRVKRLISGKHYWVHYYSDNSFRKAGYSLFGYTHKGEIYVRTNLPPKVENHILIHEAYHARDKRAWLGNVGKELRANGYAAMHDPIGFFATFIHSLNKQRIKTYWRLYVTHN